MSKETKNGLKTLGFGWLGIGLVLGIGVALPAFPTIGFTVLIILCVVFISVMLFLFGREY